MAISRGRLSALPSFLKSGDFWRGALDPRLSIEDSARFRHLREFSSSHAWSIEYTSSASQPTPKDTDLTVIEIALGNLSKLIAAEEAMDAMAADRNCGLFYQYLELHSEKFLKANPLLLSEQWVRNGGAVHDMIQRLWEEAQEASTLV